MTTSVEVAAPQAAKAVKSVEKLTPEEQIANYVASPERNERIAAFVQSAGERVVANGPSQIGYFDFYNPQNDKWKDGNNKGWGRYQHNPQYGGSASQVIVTAYQDGNGKIDPSQGIKSLHIDMFSEGQPYSVSFTAPEERQLVSDSPSTHRTGWEVSIVNTNELGKSEDPNTTWETVSGSSWQIDSESVQSIADAQRIEANAMALTDQYLAQLGL